MTLSLEQLVEKVNELREDVVRFWLPEDIRRWGALSNELDARFHGRFDIQVDPAAAGYPKIVLRR